MTTVTPTDIKAAYAGFAQADDTLIATLIEEAELIVSDWIERFKDVGIKYRVCHDLMCHDNEFTQETGNASLIYEGKPVRFDFPGSRTNKYELLTSWGQRFESYREEADLSGSIPGKTVSLGFSYYACSS